MRCNVFKTRCIVETTKCGQTFLSDHESSLYEHIETIIARHFDLFNGLDDILAKIQLFAQSRPINVALALQLLH